MFKKAFTLLVALFSLSTHAFESFDEMAKSMGSKFDAPIINSHKLLPIQDKVIILDAREKDEYEISHIKDAIHIGYDNFDLKKTLQKIPKGSKVVVYCSVGHRSGDIAQKLRKNKIDAYNLYGGIFSWNNQKLPIFDKQQNPTKKIHGFDTDWSKWIKHGDVILPKKSWWPF